ncbi:MAG: hypothetical protein FWE13_04245 [Firmicutes bacterium]|nr:hypothetical protein [Bacillota bacterium]
MRKNLQFEKNERSNATPMNLKNADSNQKDAESYAKLEAKTYLAIP